ncbi:TetR/AcrR family transcriptional regulator [Enterococcus sp. AZ126]|uniref:TetR/AcrR family transcriptional regulator n=1 Tax=Enterococcus sp. AZ126 TaxID=2774635 RepID=UPI003F28BC77
MDLRDKRTLLSIKKTFFDLLLKKDLKKITIDDICNQAMIGRSTFYNHFHDKYEFLERENQKICEIINDTLKERFLFEDVEDIFTELFNSIDTDSFMILIEIQEEGVNLKKDIHKILETHFTKFATEIYLEKNGVYQLNFQKNYFVLLHLRLLKVR